MAYITFFHNYMFPVCLKPSLACLNNPGQAQPGPACWRFWKLQPSAIKKKVSIHTASRIVTRLAVCRVRVRVRVSYSQASRVYILRMAIHTAMGKASRVYSISHKKNTCCTPVPRLRYVYTPLSLTSTDSTKTANNFIPSAPIHGELSTNAHKNTQNANI